VLNKLKERLKEKNIGDQITNIAKEIRTLREKSFPATARRPTIEPTTETQWYEMDADGMLNTVAYTQDMFEQDNEPDILNIGCDLLDGVQNINVTKNLETSHKPLEESNNAIVQTEPANTKINILQNICINNIKDHSLPNILDINKDENNLEPNEKTVRLNLVKEVVNEPVEIINNEKDNDKTEGLDLEKKINEPLEVISNEKENEESNGLDLLEEINETLIVINKEQEENADKYINFQNNDGSLQQSLKIDVHAVELLDKTDEYNNSQNISLEHDKKIKDDPF
jgi:hypothetical protein